MEELQYRPQNVTFVESPSSKVGGRVKVDYNMLVLAVAIRKLHLGLRLKIKKNKKLPRRTARALPCVEDVDSLRV